MTTKKQIKDFKKEINIPVDVDLKKLFYKIIHRKNINISSDIELRALFYRALLLSDDEKKMFSDFLGVFLEIKFT